MKAKTSILLLGTLAMGLALAYGPRMGAAPNPARPGVGTPQAGVAAGLPRSFHDDVARLLGLSVDELTALHRSGKSLLDIAKERGVDAAKLQAELAKARDAAIDQAVKAGRISEAQAAMMKARAQVAIQTMLERQAGPNGGQPHGQAFGMRARHGGPGGMGPRWNR